MNVICRFSVTNRFPFFRFCSPIAFDIQRTLATKSDFVLVDNFYNTKVITLNRPKVLNALNLEMVRTLYDDLKSLNENKSHASLVVIKGAGGKAFCAGGDVIAVTSSYKEGTTVYKDFFSTEYKLNHLIGTLKIPFVALIDGITMGGGCGVSLNGRFRVATEKTILAMPETALGLFPDVGASFFLSRLKRNLGIFLALTGHRLLGADVYHAGLATHYVESKNLEGLTKALIDLSREKCNEMDVMTVLNKFVPKTFAPFSLQKSLDKIEKAFNEDTVEKVLKNLENINSEFAKEQIRVIQTMSPTSLKVTLRQIREGKNLNFAEVFPVEYRLTQRFIQEHDLHEGCRAILIDKDHKPKWKPSKLSDISNSIVDWYFSPLENSKDELIIV